jgi:hypothetical protein
MLKPSQTRNALFESELRKRNDPAWDPRHHAEEGVDMTSAVAVVGLSMEEESGTKKKKKKKRGGEGKLALRRKEPRKIGKNTRVQIQAEHRKIPAGFLEQWQSSRGNG